MKCTQCGKDFEAVRSTAKFCSGACKLKASRGTQPTEAPQAQTEAVNVYPGSTNESLNTFKAMDHDHQMRVLFLMGCCRITQQEAIDQVLENDAEEAQA